MGVITPVAAPDPPPAASAVSCIKCRCLTAAVTAAAARASLPQSPSRASRSVAAHSTASRCCLVSKLASEHAVNRCAAASAQSSAFSAAKLSNTACAVEETHRALLTGTRPSQSVLWCSVANQCYSTKKGWNRCHLLY
jgi:hypothetical protein